METEAAAKVEVVEAAQEADVLSMLKEIRDDVDKQRKYARSRRNAMRIVALCGIAIAFAVCYALFTLLPKVDSALVELNTITAQLGDIDFVGMTDQINDLAKTGTEGITTALEDVQVVAEKFAELDIESMNKSIEDLGNVMEPLANFFNR